MTETVVESVHVRARPATVFRYFTEPAAIVEWMGEYAELEPEPDGQFLMHIRGSVVRGSYQVVEPPHRVVFTWGRVGSEQLPPGSSTVEVRFESVDDGTRVTLTHTGLPGPERPKHVDGWRHFLGRLAASLS